MAYAYVEVTIREADRVSFEAFVSDHDWEWEDSYVLPKHGKVVYSWEEQYYGELPFEGKLHTAGIPYDKFVAACGSEWDSFQVHHRPGKDPLSIPCKESRVVKEMLEDIQHMLTSQVVEKWQTKIEVEPL